LLRDPSGITELPATGLPLGLFSASTYEAPTAALQPGAALVLVSRGVVEAACKKEEYGLERVKQQFERSSNENAKGMATAILDDVQQFMRCAPALNDLTALALVRAENGKLAVGA
jgi:serine phosphatase RsbU (regulator of sigma subunit)